MTSEATILGLNQEQNIESTQETRQSFKFLTEQLLRQYKLGNFILKSKAISEIHRAQLRNWVEDLCARCGLLKKTSGLACYYMDLLFLKGYTCKLKQLQLYGTVCILIANKLQGSNVLPLTLFGLKSKQLDRVSTLEQNILFNLDFKLNPITHHQVALSLFQLWAEFSTVKINLEQNPEIIGSFQLSQKMKSNLFSIKFAYYLLSQFLDFALQIVDSLQFDLDALAFNSFFIILCVQAQRIGYYLIEQKVEKFYSKHFWLAQTMEKFSSFCVLNGFLINTELKPKYGNYLFEVYNYMISEFDKNQTQTFFDPNNYVWQVPKLLFIQMNFFQSKEKSLRGYLQAKEKKSQQRTSADQN